MNTPFIPIQGKRNTIQAQSIVEGNLYFATDTGEMFLDTATDRIPVGGGGASILYSSAPSVTQDLMLFISVTWRIKKLLQKRVI